MDNEDVISEFIKGELIIFTFNQELIHWLKVSSYMVIKVRLI